MRNKQVQPKDVKSVTESVTELHQQTQIPDAFKAIQSSLKEGQS